jgi:hypothetical protein
MSGIGHLAPPNAAFAVLMQLAAEAGQKQRAAY